MQGSSNSNLIFERALGFNGTYYDCVHMHPLNSDAIAISGSCIIIWDTANPSQQHFLRGHDDQITCLDLSNSGKMIASGQQGNNSDVLVWDYETKRVRFRLSEHDFGIQALKFSHDDRMLLTAGNFMDKKIFVWDTSNGKIVASSKMIPDPTIVLEWGGFQRDVKSRETDEYQFATAGKQVCIWGLNAKTGQLTPNVINTGNVAREYLSLRFTKDANDLLFAGTNSGDFQVFLVKFKSLQASVNVCSIGVTYLRYVEPNQIIAGGGDGSITAFRLERGKFVMSFSMSLTGRIMSMSFDTAKTKILVATASGFVFFLKYSDGTFTKPFAVDETHATPVLAVAYDESSPEFIASSSEDGIIRMWDKNSHTVKYRISVPTKAPAISLYFKDEVLLTGWRDGKLRMFQASNGKEIWMIDNAQKNGVTCIDMSKDMKMILTGGADGEARLWEMKSKKMLSNYTEHAGRITAAQLIPGSQTFLTSSKDKSLLLWDINRQKRVGAFIQRMGGINTFDFLPSSSQFISTGQDRKITFWDLREPNPLKIIDTGNDFKTQSECFTLRICPNGNTFMTGGTDSMLREWDVRTYSMLSQNEGHSGAINSLSIASDSKAVVSGAQDGAIAFWSHKL